MHHTFDIALPTLPVLAKYTDGTPFDGTPLQNHLLQVNERLNAHIDGLDTSDLTALGKHVGTTLALRSQAMDKVLSALLHAFNLEHLALFAIGGYGRGELFLHSDVDILLLGDALDKITPRIEAFVATLWNIGITPAISVRHTNELCQAVCEHTIATALLESRLIAGNQTLAHLPVQAVKQHWHAKAFFDAKMAESKARYLSHNATEYNLEPNVKTAPGTLRDLHIIAWLGKFYFDDVRTLADLSNVSFVSPDQMAILQQAQYFLWCIRHHLHVLSGRCDDRLLFDHQKNIAKRLKFAQNNTDSTALTHALEAMMRLFYRHAMQVAALCEMLCAYFNERYLSPLYDTRPLNEHFYQITPKDNPQADAQIAIFDDKLFIKRPEALLEIFLLMGKHGIKKVAASTLKALHLASTQIDDTYRQNPKHQALFLANLQQPNYLYHRLRIMVRYGILGNYLPAFGQIMGLMQYDLFHRYTVDAHTLLLVRILHRFGDTDNAEYGQKFDLVSEVYQKINRKDLLVIAALFHDIAKGRGGDHSELGAKDVYEFGRTHGLDQDDTEFVAWLVREHLTMSLTAQKQDIFDPDVIGRFAKFTRTIAHLNHLYVLTVADMNATNSQLWNTWRASLLKQLYISTHRVLSLGAYAADKDVMIDSRKTDALALISPSHHQQIYTLWGQFGEEFFLKQKHTDIAWQSEQIIKNKAQITQKRPIIALRRHSDLALGAVQLLICTADQKDLFARTVGVLDQAGLSVLDATILTADIDGVAMALDSYVLIDRFACTTEQGASDDVLSNRHRQQQLFDGLCQAFVGEYTPPQNRQFGLNAKLKHFNVPTQVHFSEATEIARAGHHMMSLVTKDRPALLATLGAVFSKLDIEVHGARITTLGERAEDFFYISDQNACHLNQTKLDKLKQALMLALE